MEISYAFFAEAAQLTSDGRVNVLGIDADTLKYGSKPPWTVKMFYLVAGINFGQNEWGRLYHFSAELIAPGGESIPMPSKIERDFVTHARENPDMLAKMKIVVEMGGFALPPVPCVYHMLVRVEDRERRISQEKRIPLVMAEATKQNQPAGIAN